MDNLELENFPEFEFDGESKIQEYVSEQHLADKQDKFVIDNDRVADWAIRIIKNNEKERDRLVNLAEEQIAELTEQKEKAEKRCEQQNAFLKSCLFEYFANVPHSVTKTQESYRLIAGTLVFKPSQNKIEHNDDVLINNLDGTEYVKIKKTVDWANYKKTLAIVDGNVINTETGEMIEGCKVSQTEPSFSVKTN